VLVTLSPSYCTVSTVRVPDFTAPFWPWKVRQTLPMLPTEAARSAATSYVVPPANRRRRPLRRRHPVRGVVTITGCLLAYVHVRLHAPDRLGHETADEVAEHIFRMMGMSPAEAHEVSHRPLP
jgi:hypothetical protein